MCLEVKRGTRNDLALSCAKSVWHMDATFRRHIQAHWTGHQLNGMEDAFQEVTAQLRVQPQATSQVRTRHGLGLPRQIRISLSLGMVWTRAGHPHDVTRQIGRAQSHYRVRKLGSMFHDKLELEPSHSQSFALSLKCFRTNTPQKAPKVSRIDTPSRSLQFAALQEIQDSDWLSFAFHLPFELVPPVKATHPGQE